MEFNTQSAIGNPQSGRRSDELGRICRQVLRNFFPSFREAEVVASFYPYVGLTHTIRKKGEGWAIRISDHCRHAPGAVLEAIAVLLACKVLRRRAPRDMEEIYEQFRRDPELEAGLRRRRLQRGRKLINSSKGRHHALQEIFEELNARYFNHQLQDRKSTRLNSSHRCISYAVFCLKKK